MEADAYLEMARVQDQHWWFRARKEILSRIIDGLNLSQRASILEIGCGTGGNIDMLRSHGKVTAIESNDYARQYTGQHKDIAVLKGSLPDALPTEEKSFDLVCLLDVLEHIEQDREALVSLQGCLKPDGVLLLTVPAYQWLYGPHDQKLHHYRRYTLSTLSRTLKQSGFSVQGQSYFNTLLFPPVLVVRLLEVLMRSKSPKGNELPAPMINSALYQILRTERLLLPRARLPFGSSIVVWAKRCV